MCLIGTETLTVMTCGECGIQFAMPESYRAERKKDGKGWHCPNGHVRVYRKSDVDEWKEAYERECRTAASLRENMIAAQRGQQKAEKKISQLKKRAAAGVCPCCNRTFAQLAQHMKSKHKEFTALHAGKDQKLLTTGVQ